MTIDPRAKKKAAKRVRRSDLAYTALKLDQCKHTAIRIALEYRQATLADPADPESEERAGERLDQVLSSLGSLMEVYQAQRDAHYRTFDPTVIPREREREDLDDEDDGDPEHEVG